MNFKKFLIAFCAASGLFASSALADEGMWVLHKIDPRTEAAMQQLGLKLNAKQLYDPQSGVSLKDAVVDFGDFCSGVVVSKDGLVFTNHHCGFGAIQSLSTTEDDILKNGFVAHSYAEERPAEGLYVNFLQETIDVTDRVMAGINAERRKDMADPERPYRTEQQLYQYAGSKIMEEIHEEYRQQYPGPTYEVRAQAFYGQSKAYISIYKVYRDVRLVFTPTQTLGKFGGDTDNWMWPRQTCDFSVFRIYADKDGNPAEYSPNNVPLHPKRWAQVSLQGYAPGDYCMTIGYPGSTSRYLSSYGITERMEMQNKPRIEVRGLKQDVWTKWMKRERAIGIKYASKFASSSNYWKNSIGMNKALTDLGVVGQKQQLEQRIQRWVDQSEVRKVRFGNMLPTLKDLYAKRGNLVRNIMYFSETLSGCEIATAARQADRLVLAEGDEDKAVCRKGYEDYLKDYDARLDEEATAALLKNLAEKLDAQYLPTIIDTVKTKFNGDYAAYARDLFSRSVVVGRDPISKVEKMDKEALQNDPALLFRQEMVAAYGELSAEINQYSADIEYNENLLTQAFLEMEQESPHYSDANFSMRLSYGIIQDYTAGGTHYQYYTNAQSLLDKAAKQQEIEDYLLEDNIIDLLKQGDFGRYADKRTKEMQLCFLSNNDITGGNSGSPMFNGKGELIGLAFDGNWEAMSGDISFDPALQRCIGVDIRFVLYLIDKWGHADNLIKEIGAK